MIKPKEELILELKKYGYYYKNVFNNISFEEKKQVYKLLKNDGYFDNEEVYEDICENILIIFFNNDHEIVSITSIEEIYVHEVSGNFYNIFGYTFKRFRSPILVKYLFPITYHESNLYVIENELNIDGLYTCIQHKKTVKHIRGKKIIDDNYKQSFYIGNLMDHEKYLNRPMYISYYPTSKFNYGK